MIIMYKRICIQRMKCRGRLILCCVAREEMPEALDNGSQPYSRAYGYGEPTVTVREARESKWLVWDCPNNNSLPLGRRHCLILSLT